MLESHDEQALNLHSEPLEEQAPNSYAKEYYDMLEADDEPLYEGCQKYSTLEAATRDPRSPLGTGIGMENDSPTRMGTGMRMRLINGDGDGKYDPRNSLTHCHPYGSSS
ncbi:hypothetical protein Tco_0449996 [Tanacetum coccineum]